MLPSSLPAPLDGVVTPLITRAWVPWEESEAKGFGSPKGSALWAKQDHEERNGTCPFIHAVMHREFWRYS